MEAGQNPASAALAKFKCRRHHAAASAEQHFPLLFPTAHLPPDKSIFVTQIRL